MTSSKNPPPVAKSSVYARFIPREEVSSFAAWNPGALSGGAPPDAHGVHKASGTPPPTPAPEPVEDGAALQRAVRQAGYQDGYRDGLKALEAFKQSYATQITMQVGQLMQALGEQLDDLQQDMARSLAISSTQLARKIVRSELVARPELVAAVAQEAIDTLLLNARHITLRVHPDDQPLVAQGAAEVLTARGVRLLGDASVLRGGCIVESDIGVIDASMETRWRRAAATLGIDEPWTGSAHPPEDNVA